MPQFSAILFDLDGTLVDTPKLWRDAYRMTFQKYGCDLSDETFAELYPHGKTAGEWMTHVGVDTAHEKDFRAQRDAIYERLLRECTEWHPGAEELVQCASEKFPTGIITTSHTSYIDAIEKRIPLRSIVDTLIDVDMVERLKPDPEGLLMAAAELGVDPATCLYIGDQPIDVKAAANAGMECWIVQTEFTPQVQQGSMVRAFTAITNIHAALADGAPVRGVY